MLWFYERNGERLRCEIRLATTREGYELAVTQPDAAETVEHFCDFVQLLRREHELDRAWKAQGWRELNEAPPC